MGFSLLELMVVVVLLAGLMAIVIPAINSIAGADVKNEAQRLAGFINQIHIRARMLGITHRINIDFDNQSYWAEIKEGGAGNISPDIGYKDLMDNLVAKGKKEAEKSFEYQYLPQFKELPKEPYDPLSEKITLGKNIVFHGAWTAGMDEIARTGIVSIYFYDVGLAQESFVSLALKGDEEDTSIYVSPDTLREAAITIDLGEPNLDLLKDKGKQEGQSPN